MPGRNSRAACQLLVALSVLLLGADRALAYAGPGVDVTFIGYAMTLVLWVLAAFSAVLLWPAYALLRVLRGRKDRPATPPPEAVPEESRAASPTDS